MTGALIRFLAAYAAVLVVMMVLVSPSDAARPRFTVESTSYCLLGTMADGTYTRGHSVASNMHPLGTKIKVVKGKRFRGKQFFVIRDRIGHGSQLDFWSPSCDLSFAWGRRTVTYEVLRKR